MHSRDSPHQMDHHKGMEEHSGQSSPTGDQEHRSEVHWGDSPHQMDLQQSGKAQSEDSIYQIHLQDSSEVHSRESTHSMDLQQSRKMHSGSSSHTINRHETGESVFTRLQSSEQSPRIEEHAFMKLHTFTSSSYQFGQSPSNALFAKASSSAVVLGTENPKSFSSIFREGPGAVLLVLGLRDYFH